MCTWYDTFLGCVALRLSVGALYVCFSCLCVFVCVRLCVRRPCLICSKQECAWLSIRRQQTALRERYNNDHNDDDDVSLQGQRAYYRVYVVSACACVCYAILQSMEKVPRVYTSQQHIIHAHIIVTHRTVCLNGALGVRRVYYRCYGGAPGAERFTFTHIYTPSRFCK